MAITKCTVTGNVKNLLGEAVDDCKIKVSVPAPFFHTGTWISGEIGSVTTDSTGAFSIDVIETQTLGKRVSFTFDYSDGVSLRKTKTYSVVVPNLAASTLVDMVTIEAVAASTATIAASKVTVTASGNLASTNAQDALTELQTDIDARATSAALTSHTGAASGAHAASAISSTPSGNLAASDVQGALNELQTDIDTANTNHTNHLADTADAHDASAISSVPSGSLAATDVQAALNELQTDVDTRATSAALTTHTGATTSVHGIADTAALATKSGTETLSNKTISTASNTIQSGAAASGTVFTADGAGGTSWSTVGSSKTVNPQTGAYTLTSSDDIVLADATAGAFTLTLPAAASNSGKVYRIKKTDSTSNAVTIDGNAAETIDGAATKSLSFQYHAIEIASNGTNWVRTVLEDPRSEIWLTGHAGFATSATRVPYFSTVQRNAGTAVTLTTNNSTNGCSFTINEDGLYSMSFLTSGATGGNQAAGFSLNSASLSTAISSLGAAERISMQFVRAISGVHVYAETSATIRLYAGDVVRPHAFDNVSIATSEPYVRITKVSN